MRVAPRTLQGRASGSHQTPGPPIAGRAVLPKLPDRCVPPATIPCYFLSRKVSNGTRQRGRKPRLGRLRPKAACTRWAAAPRTAWPAAKTRDFWAFFNAFTLARDLPNHGSGIEAVEIQERKCYEKNVYRNHADAGVHRWIRSRPGHRQRWQPGRRSDPAT